MRWFVILISLACLIGCGAGKEIIKLDKENYAANKELAKESLKLWSFNSGFITCAGFSDKVRFPITTAQEARALLQNTQITLALAELDEIAKRRGVWLDDDYDYGCSLGLKAKAATLSTIDILKLFPTIAPYVGAIFP